MNSVPPVLQSPPSRSSLADFVRNRSEVDRGHGLFELESDRMLEVNLSDRLWIKTGAMVAYVGSVRFTREGLFDHGIGTFLKRSLTSEGIRLTKAEGRGRLYLADGGKKVNILDLQGEDLFVNGNDVLAFEPSLQYEIRMMRRVSKMLAGGLFNVRFSGTGALAITTHFDPLVLRVEPGQPVFSDPNATVAWSGSLSPEIHTDISLKTFFGRASGESIQLRFEGSGFIVVQPCEEVHVGHGKGGSIDLG